MSRRYSPSSRRGIASVEAAVVLPIIVLLVFGFIEVGYFVNCQQVVHDAARQGARAAVRHENSNAEVQTAVLTALDNAFAVDSSAVTVRISKLNSSGVEQYQVMNLSSNENGDPIRVTVTVDYDQFNSPSNFLGLAAPSLSNSVTMQRLK